MFPTHRGPEGGISPGCQMHGALGEIENQSWSCLFNINQQYKPREALTRTCISTWCPRVSTCCVLAIIDTYY